MLSHLFGQCAKTDRSEEIDRKSGILGMIFREEALHEWLESRIVEEALLHDHQAQILQDLLEHDLHEDTGG